MWKPSRGSGVKEQSERQRANLDAARAKRLFPRGDGKARPSHGKTRPSFLQAKAVPLRASALVSGVESDVAADARGARSRTSDSSPDARRTPKTTASRLKKLQRGLDSGLYLLQLHG